MKKNKTQNSKTFKNSILAVGSLILMVGTPVLAAVLVQNFISGTVEVENPPIVKLQGADANYDGDNNDATGFLRVNLGGTISNNDDTLGTPGSTPTLLSNEQITFACFTGDRTYYTDVIQLQNTTATETWDVTLTIEDGVQGATTTPATATTFADTAGDGSDADIWLFTSAADSTTPITSNPNPGNYGTLTDWQDAASPNGAIQLEVTDSSPAAVGGVSLTAASTTTGPFSLAPGEQRQLALVVDCGANMNDEAGTTNTGTFNLTVAATPN